ncbi:MAG: SpoIIE family protein phosphatase [Spirochaetes bacterium]|nr:SpoIIE family protein phosphatase [Spirochaetota bacterium]
MSRGGTISIKVVIASAVLLCGIATLHAAPPIVLAARGMAIPAGPSMDILKDPGKRLTIDDIVSGRHSGKFVRSREHFPGFGYSPSACWVRFRVKNPGPDEIKWCLEVSYPLIDRIDLYGVDDTGRVADARVTGDQFPFRMREMAYRNFVFKLAEPPKSGKSYYVRFETRGPMNLYLFLRSWDMMTGTVSRSQIIFGLFYGAMLVMLVYNLFVFFAVRDRSYLYYVIYYSFFILVQLSINGLSYQYLWPDLVWWQNNAMPFLIIMCIAFAIQFIRHFLHVGEHLPRFDVLLRWLLWGCIALVPVSLLADYTAMLYIAIISSIAMAVLFTVISVRILALGYRPARYYVIAWSLFWTSTVIFGLKIMGLVPDNIVTRWFQQAASMVEVTLLSLGLADRINRMKRDLEGMNVNLESMVEERTRELHGALGEMERKDREVRLEFELAGNIQQGILPHMPFYYEGIKVVAYYRAMGKVGGDFYDIFHMKGGYLGVLIADASGHGMPAAFITALAKISFNEAIQRHLFPTDIFRQVNIELIEAIKTDDFVTAFLLVIGPTFDVMYGNASHQQAVVIRRNGGGIEEWDTNGLFVGSLPAANSMYEDKQDSLDYGDRVFLYTDGFTEAKNARGESFGIAAVKRLLAETLELPLEDARDAILAQWLDFTGEAPQSDDVTFLVVEIDPAYRYLTEYRDSGFSLLSKKQYAEAITELSRALSINPRDEKTHLFLGECYLKTADYSKAVNHLLQFLRNNEVDANVWFHLSQAYFHLGEFEMAHRTSQKASQLRINFVDAMILNAYSLRHLGRAGEAKNVLERVLSYDPGNELAMKELHDIEAQGL